MPAITYHPRNPPIYITDSEFWKKRNIPMFLSLSLSLSQFCNSFDDSAKHLPRKEGRNEASNTFIYNNDIQKSQEM
jgi:hypothetical protein